MKKLDKLYRSKPVEATDLIGKEDQGDPIAMSLFKSATTQAPVESIPVSSSKHIAFDPHTPEYEYMPNATSSTTQMDYFNSERQSNLTKLWRGTKQFGVNVASSIGQGLANTFDLSSAAKTITGEITGGDDNFNSSLFGLSSKDMQDWANGVAERNRIFESKPDSVNLGDFGWWAKQFASAGTGVGMGIEAIGTTLAIEAATGGGGTAAALGKLGSMMNRLRKTEQGINIIKEGLDVAKGLKSAATMYGIINRYSESRMEAQQTYDQVYNDLSQQKKEDGTEKFTNEEKHILASQGARRDFNYNLALLPLDILAYRTMVFNPISGAGEGLLEKGLEKLTGKFGKSIVGKIAGKATQFAIGANFEGMEEGFQNIAQNEGVHYANVLAGMDDGSSFAKRVGAGVTSDDFWNNYAGGVIGSPIIAGTMKLANKAMTNSNNSKLADVHKDYIENVGKMDSAIGAYIKDLESRGKTKEASVARRQFRANKALSALHLDAMTDKETAFDSHLTFLEGTLDEINNNKTDSLGDLGFTNTTPEQLEVIKKEFTDSIADAKEMKSIYDTVKNQYNKNFVPIITQDHFQLNKLLQSQKDVETAYQLHQKGLSQYDALSTIGKTIYDAEYQLKSLSHEQARLTDLYRNADNEFEKKNIEQVLQDNKDKITDTINNLNTLQGEGYEANDKKKDNEILKSALRSPAYLQTTYDREKLANDIAIKRQDIALWNDPKYIEHKTKQSISKAKTKTQVEETEKDLNAKKQNTEATQAEIDRKKSELAAKQAAEVIKQQQEEQEKSKNVPGNANLFADDSTLIESIKQSTVNTGKVQPVDNENQDQTKAEFLFSPAEFDIDKSPEDAKNNIIHGVRGLLDKLGNENSFEDLVRHVIRVQGDKVADQIFNALKYGWEKNGLAPVDYKAVYDKIFSDPMEKIMQGISGLVQTSEQMQEATDKVEKDDLSRQEKPEGFDSNGQPVYQYKGIVTNESSPKMAFVTRLTNLIQTEKEDGTIEVSHEYTEEELGTGNYVDSMQLLDPDKWNEGTEAEIRVPDNFNEIKIPVYNADGSKGKSITFGQYVAEKNLSPSDQEYQDKIPMIIYRKGAPSTEKGVAFVHDIGWYHPLRFNQEKKDDMANAISNTRGIRTAVLATENNITPIIITEKRQTTFAGLKTKPNENVSLREANPQTQITIALTTDSLSTNKKEVVFPNNSSVLINRSPFNVGDAYEIRRFGSKDGQQSFVALPILRPKLDEQARVSVLQAINIYGNRSNQQQETRKLHDPIVKHIQDTMGLDILNPQGLEKYLQHFINTFNVEKAKTNQDVEAQAKAKLPIGSPYIAFIAGGNIVFGKTGQNMIVNGRVSASFFINPNIATPNNIGINQLADPKNGIISWFNQNVSIENLNRDKPIVMIDKSLSSEVASPSYKDYLLDKLQTNVKSVNIGTKEKPNYVTNIQPVITYDLKSNLEHNVTEDKVVVSQPIQQETNKEENTSTKSTNELSEIEKNILEQAQKDLGNDFGAAKRGQNLFSPDELNEDQRKAITSDINRIAGLTPDQQFDIVNFMYNQITGLVNLDNKIATRKEIDNIVDKAFSDTVGPIKKGYKEKVQELKDLLEKHPNLQGSSVPDVIADYEYRLGKIKSVEDNIDTLKEEAYNRVAKYTGITADRIENEDTTKIDDDPNQQIDFWTDVLTESPDNKLTYSMRRFFGQIREYDRQGNPMTGFLGLPTYMGSDVVIRTLMVTLADVPSDFNTMIAKLEERKEAIPWMQEVIDRLKGSDIQKKNQFVTVMSNTSLRMKFTMISYNRKTSSWTTKVYDTNLNGVANSVKESWRNGFYDSSLTLADEEGNYKLNKERAQVLINQFEGWKGTNLKVVEGNTETLRPIADNVKNNVSAKFTPADAGIVRWLANNLVKNSDRVVYKAKGFTYQIQKLGNGAYQMSFLEKTTASKEEINNWLKEFGINLSPNTLDELMSKGLFHNYKQIKPNDLFDSGSTTNGLFGILYNKLKLLHNKEEHDFTEYGDSPLDESVISSLANLEAKYNNVNTPFGFRDNGKSLFALTAPKFITDRVRDLKTVDSTVVQQLLSTSFSGNSIWLKLLSDPKFRDKFQVSHIGLNAFRELGKKLYRDNNIMKLSDLDHELTKLGMFWDMTQGEVSYLDNENKSHTEYPDTSIGMRMATMFSPTMSDKSMMTLVTTAVLNLQNKDLLDGKGPSDDVVKVLYEQIVKPELARMVRFHQNGGSTNISGYDKGASIFMLMPQMNNIEYAQGLKLIDAIKHEPNHFTMEYIEGNVDLMTAFRDNIKAYVNQLATEKVSKWENNGIVATSQDAKEFKIADRKYIDRFRGTSEEKIRMAAMDFVINSMIANANSFMTMAGDPALYFKSKASDPVQQAKDSFVNVGKRLALLIAPGTTLANSEGEKYLQLFLKDRISVSNNIEYLERVLGKEGAESYRKIEGSDAQEYTTWKEHLDILAKLGKTPDTLLDITPEEIQEARELFSSDVTRANLTDKQLQLLGKVMQPIKPVYTGQIHDPHQDVMRTVYIKSSSFPLIPQLTVGFEIDKLRLAMEDVEKKHGMNVRASYQTANKVGAVTNPSNMWNEETGDINQENLNDLEKSSLVLDRKNFRIQQEVPFKSAKNAEDRITLGTQLMKLLFGDGMMNLNGFMYNGKEHTGKELHAIYNDLFSNLVNEKQSQLFDELGLDNSGNPVDTQKSMERLQDILKKEAVKRGYPLQDIEGLTLSKDGQFNLPLWASSNSNRYESMLNAIVTNRVIRMKFPGNSYVVGSEEGFKINNDVVIKEGMNKTRYEVTIDKKDVGEIILVRRKNGQYKIGDFNYVKDKQATKQLFYEAIKFVNSKGLTLSPEENSSKQNLDIWKELEEEGLATIRVAGRGDLGEGYYKIDAITNGKSPNTNTIDNLENIDKSKIIFTSSWNGRELQGTRNEDGTVKTAQVLAASKFRDNNNNLVDLLTKENGEYKYVTKTENGFRLKEDMFEKELLSLTSFRIPTSGHQSASQVEIVGFLPHDSADLMIVPRGFTKQKGLDFDIDKENTYQLWHYMNEDGKFEVLSEKHRDKILLAHDNKLKSGAAGKLLTAIFGDDISYSDEDIQDEKFLTKLNSKLKEKFLQNEIIKINSAILSNPKDEVQAKILKTLNTDFAEKQADFIEKLNSNKEENKYWTPLSDEYQKEKMFLGASGKIGTGAYSLDVVGHSLFQQAAMSGTPISFVEIVGEEDDKTMRPKIWQFGNIKSTGLLGGTMTLDGGRSISEVQSERQNIAVDNEKLQVMGRVNLNDITMDVDKVMNMIGFDKGKDGNSISFLFLSQPIIKEFVEKIKNANSNMAEFDPNKEQNLVSQLLAKYDATSQEEINDEYWNTMSKMMTNENFINAIQSKEPDGKLQGAVLRRFMEMKTYGIALRGVQTAINTDSKGLGKSFFDVIEKRNALNRLGMDTNLITGASNLIGEYVSRDDFENVSNKDGFVDIGQFYVRPTTLSGSFNINGVNTAYNLWNKFFPYDAAITSKAFSEVLSIIGSEEMSDSKSVELKQNIFQGIKKYFAASRFNGIINSTDDINAERSRLFIDSDNNTSLAKYLKTLKETHGNVVIDTFIKTNKLLNRFEFDINKNGQPSLIKFNNASGEEFDEQYLYESLATLMEIRGKDGRIELPEIGNKKYTLDTLAQDLIAYAYLGNAVQEAIQFTKYVPVSYLNQVGYSDRMRTAGLWLRDNPNILGVRIGSDNEKHMVSEFTMQYVQHNPEKVKYKMDQKKLNSEIIKIDDNNFYLKSEDNPIFISVYDSSIPKGEKKFKLYWFDGEKYTKIPVLGIFGMDEYQPRNSIGQSLVNGRIIIKPNPQPITNEEKVSDDNTSGLFSVNTGDITKMVEDISNSATQYKELATKLLPYIPQGIKVVIQDVAGPRGIYNKATNTITINNNIVNNADKLADTILHELVHALTMSKVENYITTNEKDRTVETKDGAPIYVTNLVRLYNSILDKTDKGKLLEIIDKVRETGVLGTNDRSKYYGLTSIYEFMTMALTDNGFQQELNKIPYKNSGMSILDKFKEVVKQILEAIGVKFDENFSAAHAISNIFGIIESNNEPKANPFDTFYDDSVNRDNFDDFIDGTDVEQQFSVDFPMKQLNIQNENCL
jgi:hypothetical protein